MYSLETIVLDCVGTVPKITVKGINAFIFDTRKYTLIKYIFKKSFSTNCYRDKHLINESFITHYFRARCKATLDKST